MPEKHDDNQQLRAGGPGSDDIAGSCHLGSVAADASMAQHQSFSAAPQHQAIIGLAASALASGTDTAASGFVVSDIEPMGARPMVFAEAVGFAMASSSPGHTAQAAAETFAQTQGFAIISERHINAHGGEGGFAWAISVLDLIAEADPQHGRNVALPFDNQDLAGAGAGRLEGAICLADSMGAQFDAPAALLSVSQTLAVEQQFSAVSTLAWVLL